MKISKSTIHLLVVLEAIVLIIVMVLSIIQPWGVTNKNDLASGNSENANSENTIPEFSEPVFSDEILEQVEEMTLEQKVAQMFITTPEALTGKDKVTKVDKNVKAAIEDYPVGGLLYSTLNFDGKTQTKEMQTKLQEFYMEETGIPIFLMVEELGGEDNSPLATSNGYSVQDSASKIGASEDTQKAVDAATAIAKYLNSSGLNTNLAPNADLAIGVDDAYDEKTYSDDVSIASMMVAETVAAYAEADIVTVMSMFPGKSAGIAMEETKVNWMQSNGLVYQAGIDAGVDAILVGNGYAEAFTGSEVTPCCLSSDVVYYLRINMHYKGLLISDSIIEEHVAEAYSVSEAAVAAVQAGMDMIYCPEDFSKAYKGVLKAVENEEISQEVIDKAVARILTCKEKLND